jgi:chromosome transmission fidelity protein 4
VADNKFHCIILKGGDQYPYFPRPLLSEFEFSIPLSSAPRPRKKKPNNLDGNENEHSDDEMLDSDAEDNADGEGGSKADNEALALTQSYLLKSLHTAQLSDMVSSSSSRSSASQRALLARLQLDIDKTLLQLLAVECREGGEERGMRALDVVRLMRDRSGRMLEAAGKVAERYGHSVLVAKIRELGEERVSGIGGEEEEEEDDEF